jgi:hypothetical protein
VIYEFALKQKKSPKKLILLVDFGPVGFDLVVIWSSWRLVELVLVNLSVVNLSVVKLSVVELIDYPPSLTPPTTPNPHPPVSTYAFMGVFHLRIYRLLYYLRFA